MNNRLFFRLARTNLVKNRRLYVPYMVSAVGMIAMFYIVQFLYKNKGLEGNGSIAAVREMVWFGGIITAIFVVIFLLYTNSFIIKQRSREFGLYGILGLEKRHIARIMLMETGILFAVCLFVGLATGVLLSKAMFLLLLRILKTEVAFGFEISVYAIVFTSALFAGIFALTLIWNLFRVHLSQPVELLRAGKAGEREPKVKWLMAISGVLCLGGGYVIAQLDMNPVTAIFVFFIAVLLVIAGLYQTFTAGSIALLKAMRGNKRYYYQTRHFISVSGMIYRMKQNAAGLASICVLSTAVLVMLSTTISMYAGMEDVLRTRFPRNIGIRGDGVSAEAAEELDGIIERALGDAGVSAQNPLRRRYRYFLMMRGENGAFIGGNEAYDQSQNVVWTDYVSLTCVPLSEYNRGRSDVQTLEGNEVLMYGDGASFEGDTMKIGDLVYRIKDRVDDFDVLESAVSRSMENYNMVIPDGAFGDIYAALGEKESSADALTYHYSFDVDLPAAEQIRLFETIRSEIKKTELNIYAECAEASREDMLSLYGGLLFLGLFLGSLFIVATVLIIYYKQVSEGYQDRERFSIMQKVGMTKGEVRSAIRSQVLSVFYLPLIMSAVNIAVAFKLISKLLAVLNLTNTGLFVLCATAVLLVFAGFYTIIYAGTARTYYRIVGEQDRGLNAMYSV